MRVRHDLIASREIPFIFVPNFLAGVGFPPSSFETWWYFSFLSAGLPHRPRHNVFLYFSGFCSRNKRASSRNMRKLLRKFLSFSDYGSAVVSTATRLEELYRFRSYSMCTTFSAASGGTMLNQATASRGSTSSR